MWIFLNNAFLSIVDKGGDGTTLLVRARKAEDIQRIFPGAKVEVSPNNDYRFRSRLDREVVALALAESVRQITYPNFKGSVTEHDRHETYMDVWQAMYRFQGRA